MTPHWSACTEMSGQPTLWFPRPFDIAWPTDITHTPQFTCHRQVLRSYLASGSHKTFQHHDDSPALDTTHSASRRCSSRLSPHRHSDKISVCMNYFALIPLADKVILYFAWCLLHSLSFDSSWVGFKEDPPCQILSHFFFVTVYNPTLWGARWKPGQIFVV